MMPTLLVRTGRLELVPAVFLLVLLGAGCAQPPHRVVATPSEHVIALHADDVVLLMQRSGFSNEEILELGTSVRNNLARTGGARVHIEETAEAIYSVYDGVVHAATRRRGSFVYDPSTALKPGAAGADSSR